jgi:hypothetical protein
MNLRAIALAMLLPLAVVSAQGSPMKVKTTPDFPAGLPPTPIYFDGAEVGTTNPGGTVQLDLPLDNEQRILKVGDTVVALWRTGLGIKGEVRSGKAKLKEGPTLVITTEDEPQTVLANALATWPEIAANLSNPDLPSERKLYFNSLKTKILNYEFTSPDVVANVVGSDPAEDIVYLEFSYFGTTEVSWQDTLKLTKEHFTGKKPAAGKRAAVLVEHFSSLPKVGMLKFSLDGSVKLLSIKTEKYKWGTYKKDGKKKNNHIGPLVFFAK